MKLDNFLPKAFSGKKTKESRLIPPESESELEKVFNGTVSNEDRKHHQRHKNGEVNGEGHEMANGTSSSTVEKPVKSRSISLVQMRGSKSFETSERKTSFSYLSLLEKNGGNFPHRTQAIMENNAPSRKNSFSGSFGNLSAATKDLSQSMEYLHNTSKRNFMARSNPIGLAEPSIKRDGYAVGKDGSFYRSSEHIFADLTSNGRSRASSSTPDRDIGTGGLKGTKQRHSSLSNLSGVGIRPGAGLISTGKRNNVHMFMPFGQSSTKKEIGYKKSSTSTSSSTTYKSQQQSRTTTSSSQNANQPHTEESSSQAAKEASTIIKKGIEEIEYLTKVADRQDVTIVQARSIRSASAKDQRENGVTSNGFHDCEKREEFVSGVNGTFQAVDMMLKSTLADEPIQFTVKRAPRARSLSRTHTSIPDQSVTISLPASRQTSRHSSVEPEGIQRQRRQRQQQQEHQQHGLTSDHRSSSVEIFNGTYEMRVPHPASRRKLSAEISEIKTEVYSFTANYDRKAQEQTSNDIIQTSNESEEAQEMPKKLTMTSTAEDKKETFTHSGAKPPSSSSSASILTTQKRERGTLSSSQNAQKQENKPLANNNHTNGVGSALKGLSTALENLQNQQNEQKSKLLAKGGKKKRNGKTRKRHDSGASSSEISVSVNVSLNSSRRSSRQTSPDRASVGSGIRSRRNSMDLFSGEYDMKMKKKGGTVKVRQKSSSHIQYDDTTKQDLKLCSRCHASDHSAQGCTEFDDLLCPRCLEWDHWEDTCPFNDSEMPAQCNICGHMGHKSSIHAVTGFQQRRAIVDTISWEPFIEWFYESVFRSWWQLNGCVGVPLYKVYRRKTNWRTEVQPIIGECDDEMSDFGRSLVRPPAENTKNYSLSKNDSLEELMKSVRAPRARRPPSVSDDPDSGRSTPEHLKKYSGSVDQDDQDEETNPGINKAKRLRTFSETLKLLDDDILAELNIDK